MKGHIAHLILFLLPLLLIRCDAIDDKLGFTKPEVVSVYPARFMTDVPGNAEITIRYSARMDAVKTNQAFSLSSGSGTVEGYFRWDDSGKVMTFTPGSELSDNLYTISLTTDAEDADGNDLDENFESTFYVNADLTPPTVMTHTPASGALGIHPDPDTDPVLFASSLIRVTFSEPMDIDSLYDGFSVSPSVQGLFSWNAACTEATFTPVYALEYGATYTVSLGDACRDLHGNSLAEQYSYSFTVGDDFTGPSLASVHQVKGASVGADWVEDAENMAAERAWEIVLTFSEPVKRETLIDALTIAPAAEYHVEAAANSTSARIVFDEPLESEAHYSLRLAQSVTDVQGNILAKEYLYRFYTNGAESTRPIVEYVTDTDHGYPPYNYPPTESWAIDDIEPLSFNDPYEDVYIIFSKEIDPVSISVDITRSFGTGGGLPALTGIDWPDIIPYGKFYIYKFSITELKPNDTYKLSIKGGSTGLRDKLGNTLEKDHVQYFKVQTP